MAILDQFGRPMQPAVLTREIAKPTLTGVRQIISGHPASGITPERLASLLREAESGDPNRAPLPPHKFIVHFHKAKSGLPIRTGLARAASWAWMFKTFILGLAEPTAAGPQSHVFAPGARPSASKTSDDAAA
jgi:phage gp29-like protein